MGLLRMFGLGDKQPASGKVRLHDFTYEIDGQSLNLVKHLDGGRVFLVVEKRLTRGDMVIVKPPRGKKGPTRFLLDHVQETATGWRAYGSVCP